MSAPPNCGVLPRPARHSNDVKARDAGSKPIRRVRRRTGYGPTDQNGIKPVSIATI
jgi:hypothetical protein